MSFCADCKRAGTKTRDCFTQAERVHILASASAMARTIHHGSGRSTEMDRKVNSSVISKMLLSFPDDLRQSLLQSFREAVGLDIALHSCPHGKLEVVQ